MIREIKQEDIEECVAVIRESFQTVADELGFTPDNAPRFTAFATTVERLSAQLADDRRKMYAYYGEEEEIAGYYSLQLQEHGECELNNLCVLPRYRHKYIGYSLVQDAFAKAKVFGCIKMNIGIVEENVRLRRWYEMLGFCHIDTKKFDFFPFTCGYMERDLRVPVNKFDLSGMDELAKLSDEEIAPLLPALLAWMRDINWPVARAMPPLLLKHQKVIIPHIIAILQPGQMECDWKASVIHELLPLLEEAYLALLAPSLRRIIQDPTEGEKDEGTYTAAKELSESIADLVFLREERALR